MSDRELTFVERCIRGEALLDDIDEAIEQWHTSSAIGSLPQYLGFTDEEYAAWLENASALKAIIHSRRNHLPLSEVLEGR